MEQKCKCKAPLPHHLASVGLKHHVCSCHRAYTVNESKEFIETGVEPNPFADFDAAMRRNKKLRTTKRG